MWLVAPQTVLLRAGARRHRRCAGTYSGAEGVGLRALRTAVPGFFGRRQTLAGGVAAGLLVQQQTIVQRDGLRGLQMQINRKVMKKLFFAEIFSSYLLLLKVWI